MQIADLAAVRRPSDPTLSPDGTTVAVAVSRMDLDDNEYRSELWLAPMDGSAPPRRFTHGPSDAQPRWSPDGRWLAFVRTESEAKPQLFVMAADGGEPRRLTDHPLGAGDPVWSPDSTRLAYICRVPEDGRYGTDEKITPDKEPPRRITTRKYRVDNVGFTIDRRPHLFVVDALAETCEPLQLTRGDYDHAEPAWSPDGRTLAFVAARHDERDTDLISDIFLVPAEGGDARQVTDTTQALTQPVFTPDGSTICYRAQSNTDIVGRNTQLFRIPADGSAAPQALSEAEPWDFDAYGSGSSHPLLVDDDSAVTLCQRRGGIELVRVPFDGGKPEVLTGGPRQILAADRAKGGVMALLVATDTNAGELVARQHDGTETTLSDFGSGLARTTSLRPMTEIITAADDGYEVHGWVVKPAGNGPFPVVLSIHGGPFTQYGWTLSDEAQVYAGAGYAVVLGNPRGSSGYGEAHGRVIVADMGNRDHADLLALLDKALADEDLDADRVGVMGGSYGGYMTGWMLGHEHRFAAGIVERALTSFDSFTGSSDIGWFFSDSYAGPDPDRQRAQSPLTHADNIDVPVLVVHSEQDWRCPLEQGQRLYERLKRNGVETELLVFPGEGHELSRSGLPSHRVARFEAILDWWARHLQGAQ
ncbi:MAG: S9 family peptidase [Actinomycetota bacterium]|nr:S9 family peptidase [Actinomycetota bacterium]